MSQSLCDHDLQACIAIKQWPLLKRVIRLRLQLYRSRECCAHLAVRQAER